MVWPIWAIAFPIKNTYQCKRNYIFDLFHEKQRHNQITMIFDQMKLDTYSGDDKRVEDYKTKQ